MTKKQKRVFKQRVAELVRSCRGLGSQMTFAKKIGATQAQVSQWESGKALPSLLAFVEFARACEVNMNVLYGYTEEVGHE